MAAGSDIRIERATIEDAHAIADLSEAAFEHDGLRLLFAQHGGQSIHDKWVGRMTQFLNESCAHVFKAILTEYSADGSQTNRVVGFSQWYLGYVLVPKTDPFAQKPAGGKTTSADLSDISVGERNSEAPSVQEAQDTPVEHDDPTTPLQEDLLRRMGHAHVGFIRGKRHIYLRRLMVHPAYQRRGIGQRLLDWGTELADREKIVAFLESRPAGTKMYERAGWKAVAIMEVPSPDIEVAPVIAMIRQPQSKPKAD